jgi:hypothetical protein
VAALAADRDLPYLRLRALNNLTAASQYDKYHDLDEVAELDVLTERLGEEAWLVRSHFFAAMNLIDSGDIEAAMARLAAGEEFDLSDFWSDTYEMARARVELTSDGFDKGRLDRYIELHQKYASSDDPQLSTAMRAAEGAMRLACGDLESALEVTGDMEDITSNYPEGTEVAVFAAAQLGDSAKLAELLGRLEERHSHGRASRGLAWATRSYLGAIDGDLPEAVRSFEQADQLWAKTHAPLNVAYARAVFVLLVGADNEFAALKAGEALRFFEESGYRLYLDGIIAQLPVESQGSELAG